MSLQASSVEQKFSFKKPNKTQLNKKPQKHIAVHNLFINKCSKIT